MKRDPAERDPKKKLLVKLAELEAEERLRAQGIPRLLGYCHALWGEQQEILKTKYGIDWKTPAEMNPNIIFD
jgi:hypothetical protein